MVWYDMMVQAIKSCYMPVKKRLHARSAEGW